MTQCTIWFPFHLMKLVSSIESDFLSLLFTVLNIEFQFPSRPATIILLFVEILSTFRVWRDFVPKVSHCHSQQQSGNHYIPMINLSTEGLSTIFDHHSTLLEIKSNRHDDGEILIWQRKIWIPQFRLVYLTKDSNSLSGLLAMNGICVRSFSYNSTIHPFGVNFLPHCPGSGAIFPCKQIIRIKCDYILQNMSHGDAMHKGVGVKELNDVRSA